MSKLNASNIHTLEPATDDHFEWDESMHGFGLRIRNRKHRTLIVQYKLGSKHRRINLGTVGKIDFKDAVRRAKKIFGHVADGIDPAEAKAATPKTVAHSLGATIPKYLDARTGDLRPSTWRATKAYLEEHWSPLHNMPLGKIKRADVATVLTTIEKRGRIAANRARSALSGLFGWAMGEGWCEENPVIGTNQRSEGAPRERSLSDVEAARVWLAAPDKDYGRLIKLILLTGCRRSELGRLKWSEVDLEAHTITLPRGRTKNGQEHVVPLSGPAMEILAGIAHRREREHVFGRSHGKGFAGWAKAKQDLDAVLTLDQPWTVHDLRRTVRTGLGKLGVQPHIAEATLNHLPPKLIRTYDRNSYADEKRSALDKWASHLKVCVAQATGANVTALRKGDSAASRKS
jgi:integrase